jgi:hypothetical protein
LEGAEAAAIEMLNACVVVLLALSVTSIKNDEVPDAVGTPEMTPVEDTSRKPAGKTPDFTAQPYGGAPSLACKDDE